MGWWMAAAAATPYIMNMLMPQPSQPQAQPIDMTAQNQVLKNAMNPDMSGLNRASDTAQASVGSSAARMGLGRSSAALGAQANTQAQLASNWQENAIKNQIAALQPFQAGNEFNANLQNRYAMMAYNNAQQQRMNMIGGAGSLAQAGAYAYGMNQTNNSTPYTNINFNMPDQGTMYPPTPPPQFGYDSGSMVPNSYNSQYYGPIGGN